MHINRTAIPNEFSESELRNIVFPKRYIVIIIPDLVTDGVNPVKAIKINTENADNTFATLLFILNFFEIHKII